MTRWISFALLLGVIAVVGAVFYRVMSSFLLPLFLAVILVVMFRPLHVWFLVKTKQRPRLAAALTTVTITLIVLLPGAVVGTLAAIEASTVVAHFDVLQGENGRGKKLREKLDIDYPHADEIRYLESSLETLLVDARHGATAVGNPVAYERLDGAFRELLANLQADQVALAAKPSDQVASTDNPADLVQRAIAQRTLERLRTTQTVGSDLAKKFEQIALLKNQPTQIGTPEYLILLRETSKKFREFKLKLLGDEWRAWIKEVVNPSGDELGSLAAKLFVGAPGFLRSVGGATSAFMGQLVMSGAIMVLAVYFFLVDGPTMLVTLMRLSPIDDRHEQTLIDEFDRISRAVVVATLLSAVIQGLLAGLGFWLAGTGSVFLLTLLAMVFALVPFVGATAVWIPACVYLYFFADRPTAAIVLGVYCLVVVSNVDNFVKPWVLQGQSNLHPLLALLSVLGGVQTLGPIGILVGPMIVVFLQTLLNILHREMSLDQSSRKTVS